MMLERKLVLERVDVFHERVTIDQPDVIVYHNVLVSIIGPGAGWFGVVVIARD